MSIPLIIILVIVVVLVVAVIGLYNNLVKLRNMVDNAWAQIDVQLQRRLDLIPNLVPSGITSGTICCRWFRKCHLSSLFPAQC